MHIFRYRYICVYVYNMYTYKYQYVINIFAKESNKFLLRGFTFPFVLHCCIQNETVYGGMHIKKNALIDTNLKMVLFHWSVQLTCLI